MEFRGPFTPDRAPHATWPGGTREAPSFAARSIHKPMASDSQANEKRKRRATQKIARLKAQQPEVAAPAAAKKYVTKKKAAK